MTSFINVVDLEEGENYWYVYNNAAENVLLSVKFYGEKKYDDKSTLLFNISSAENPRNFIKLNLIEIEKPSVGEIYGLLPYNKKHYAEYLWFYKFYHTFFKDHRVDFQRMLEIYEQVKADDPGFLINNKV